MNEATFGPWRKSSFSDGAGACVELTHSGTTSAVRDSKNPEAGHLEVPLAGLISPAKDR